MMKMSHYFYVMLLGFGFIANVSTVVAMQDDKEQAPSPMAMEDGYYWEQLMKKPVEEMLKRLGETLLKHNAEIEPQISQCCCIKGFCCPCCKELAKLEEKLAEIRIDFPGFISAHNDDTTVNEKIYCR